MAQNTSINFKRLKPLTLDGLWHSDYEDGSGQYPFSDTEDTHFYYWLVDNIPFLRLNERDALFTKLMNLGYISAFPYKNYTKPLLTDLTPVIVDFQNGYIHQSFSKQNLSANENIGFVISKLGSTTNTYYTDDSGINYYYVVININNIILPFDKVHVGSSQTKPTLVPEQTKLYIDLHGNFCTLAYNEEKVSRLDDTSTEVAIEAGIITKVVSSGSVFVCNLTPVLQLGPSTGIDNINHSNLEDIEAYETKRLLNEDLPDLYVYGHYGYQTKIEKFTSVSEELKIYDPIGLDTGSTIKKYDGTNQFIGYLYYIKTTDNGTEYYVVTCGEFNFATDTLTAGETHYITNTATLISESNTSLSPLDRKIGIALSTTTLLLESNTSSFNVNFLTNLGITTYDTTTKGEQVGLTADTFGIPVNHKILYGKSYYGTRPVTVFPSLTDTLTGLSTQKRYSYMTSHTTPSSSNWASGWGDSNTDKPMFGFIQQPPVLFVQRLSPEYDSTGDIRYDRIFVYLSSTNLPHYHFLNALDVSATENTTINWSPAFQSDLEASGHAITYTSTSLTYGTMAELTITVATDFVTSTPTMQQPTTNAKTFYPTTKGISLKPNNGLVAFYNTTTTPICSSTIYCYYEKVEPTTTPKQYKFTNCTLFNTKSLNSVASIGESSTSTATATLSATQPNYVISIPTGAFTFKTGGVSSPVLAGMYNANQYFMSQFSKYTMPFVVNAGEWVGMRYDWVNMPGGGVGIGYTSYYIPYRQALGPMGFQSFSYGQTMTNMSIFQTSPYNTIEATSNFTYPLLAGAASGTGTTQASQQNFIIDTAYNFYKYIDIDTMYINPHNAATAPVTALLSLHDRIPVKLRLGTIGQPFVKTFYDSFVFCNSQTMVMGFDVRPSISLNRGKYKTSGTGTIIYIARQNVDTTEDYVDIHLDPTALAYQIHGDFGNSIPATASTSAVTISHAYNYDITCMINNKQYIFGLNDTIRIWLPPDDETDDIRYDNIKELSTRQKPYLTLTYLTAYEKERLPWINDTMYIYYPMANSTPGPGGGAAECVKPIINPGPMIAPHTGD